MSIDDILINKFSASASCPCHLLFLMEILSLMILVLYSSFFFFFKLFLAQKNTNRYDITW